MGVPDGKRRLYGDLDPREMPAYTVPEAARYLKLPVATVRSWALGRYYPTSSGRRFFRPVIRLADSADRLLSFLNLVEAHVLAGIRRHGVKLDKIRIAIRYLARHFPSPRPLADHRFETDGLDLFVEKYGQLINVSRGGQLAIRESLKSYLRRIERDSAGLPIKLYPFTGYGGPQPPRSVVIDPLVSFGRPVLLGTGIPTSAVFERYQAGESVEELAEDYNLTSVDIQEAIRCEAA